MTIFQDDLNNMVCWADKLRLQLNITKCNSMIFARLKFPIMFDYKINGSVLKFFDKLVTDLSMVFCPTLKPNLLIGRSRRRTLKMLGFTKRILIVFKLVSSLKALYCSLVRPILEYGFVIWDFNYVNKSLTLRPAGRVQADPKRIVFLLRMRHLGARPPPLP